MDFYDDLEILVCKHAVHVNTQRVNQPFDYYGIQFIVSGGVWLQVGSEKRETAQGPLMFFTHPGEPYSYGTLPGQYRKHWYVCFKGERAKRYVESGLLPEKINGKRFFSIMEPLLFQQLFHDFKQKNSIMAKNSHARAVHALETLLLAVMDNSEKEVSSQRTVPVAELIREISEKPAQNWDFPKQAIKLNLSMSHFRRIFLQYAGLPPGKFLIECRLRAARQLLLETQIRVNEIAYAVGFRNVFHFSRIFKKQSGKSPLDYRRTYILS